MYAESATPKVECAFGFGPYDDPDTYVWTDITDYVIEAETERGRKSEFDQYNTGLASFRLQNDDRRFDPLNIDGPYTALQDVPVFPLLVSSSTETGASLGTSQSITMPSSIVAGELLLAWIVQDSTTDMTVPGGEGWTNLISSNLPASAGRLEVFAKIAAGSDTLTVTGATEDYCALVSRISNHGVTNVLDILSVPSINTGTDATPYTFVTTGEFDPVPRYYLWVAGFGADDDDNVASPWATWKFSDASGNFGTTDYFTPTEIALLESAQSTSSVMLGVAWAKGKTVALYPRFSLAATEEWSTTGFIIPPAQALGTQLVAGVPIRLYAETDDGDKPIWQGFVDSWPADYFEGGFHGEIQIGCSDGFAVLAERPLPDNVKSVLEGFEPPKAWYKMEKIVDQNWTENAMADEPRLNTYQKWTEGPGLTPTSKGALRDPGITTGQIYNQQPPHGSPAQGYIYGAAIHHPYDDEKFILLGDTDSGDVWSISMVMQADGPLPSGSNMILWQYILPPYTASSDYIYLAAPGLINDIAVTTPGGGAWSLIPVYSGVGTANVQPTNLCDGQRHLVTLVRSGAAVLLYIDGLLVGSVTDASYSFYTPDQRVGAFHGFLGTISSSGIPTYNRPPIWLDDIIFWSNHSLSANEVAGLWETLQEGYRYERTTGGLIGDVLFQLIDWPGTLTLIDLGTVLGLGQANLNGINTLEYLQSLAATEGGRLFMSKENEIVFWDRSRVFADPVQTDVQYTFTDTPGDDVGILDGSIQFRLDDTFVFEAAEITPVEGDPRTASVSGMPIRTYKAGGLMFANAAGAQSLADWIVFRYASPQVRTEEWQVDPEVKPEDWPAILDLDLGHRIAIEMHPGGVGSAIEVEQHLEYIKHTITTEDWIITFNGVPVDPNNYFVWSDATDETHGWSQDGVPPGGVWA